MQLPRHELEPKVVCCNLSGQVPWNHELLQMIQVWKETGLKGKGIVVAILDTGIDAIHPDFNGRVMNGIDFTRSFYNWGDISGHGTHCAGIIGSNKLGIAPEVTLLPVKVINDQGSGEISHIINGINWAIDAGADVINMSLGGDGEIHPQLREAIDRAILHGLIVVCAAGNSGPYPDTVGAPGNYRACVTVGAVDRSEQVANFSSRGLSLDCVAPGVDVLSTYPGYRYTLLSGTSMACPHVSGIAALWLEKQRRDRVPPSAQSNQIMFEQLLKNTCKKLSETKVELTGDAPHGDAAYGAGLVQPLPLLSQDNKPGADTPDEQHPLVITISRGETVLKTITIDS